MSGDFVSADNCVTEVTDSIINSLNLKEHAYLRFQVFMLLKIHIVGYCFDMCCMCRWVLEKHATFIFKVAVKMDVVYSSKTLFNMLS